MRDLVIYKPNNSAFTRLNKLFSKILPKQKNSLNYILISIRRNNVIKKYNLFLDNKKEIDRFNEAYDLYIQALSDCIMNKIYKKVKHGVANDDEKNILSNYYYILKLKEDKYEEYSLRKQKYLLLLDYEQIKQEKIFDSFKEVYLFKIEEIYNKLLELYDNNEIIESIIETLDEYSKDFTIFGREEEKRYKTQETEHNEDDIIEKIQKEEMLLDLSKIKFKSIISEKSNNSIYIRIIEDLNDWLNNNINKNNFKEIFNLLLRIIKKYSSNECNPLDVEKKYVLQNDKKYIELKKYLDKKTIIRYRIITSKFKIVKNIKREEIKNGK